jgi:NADP-reducing hydrogenase subunit HndB
MPRLKNLEELKKLREDLRKDVQVRNQTNTRIIVGMGTCGIAAGAREVIRAILKELEDRKINAHVETVGCMGMCAREPLVDIEQAGMPRVTYVNVQPDMVPKLIEEHLVKGQAVQEWALGRLESGNKQ